MIRVLLAAPQPDVRAALRLLLLDFWDLITVESGNTLTQLREACPAAVVIVLISQLDARHQAALSAGADAFISKGEMPDRVADRLRAAAELVIYS
jgi:DNA-binding NarL/FixJ family response regulator